MEIYERMKEYIVKNHLKQSSIARDMGVLDSTFSMLLSGKRVLTADELQRFCRSVKQPPELFMMVEEDEGA